MAVTYRVYVEKLGGSDPDTFVGVPGELFYDPAVGILKRSDGTTPGGEAVSVQSSGINSIIKITQAEYDALDPVDENTLYVIVG